MNIPNILTFIRLCLIPVFVWQFFGGDMTVAAWILVISGLTDVLDGYIARRFNMVTKWGIVFDPLADKLTQATAAFCIAMKLYKPMWIVFAFIFIKELGQLLGGTLLYKKSETVVKAKWYGKVATFVFYCAFFLFILIPDAMSSTVKTLIIIVALAFSLLALISYARMFFKLQKKIK